MSLENGRDSVCKSHILHDNGFSSGGVKLRDGPSHEVASVDLKMDQIHVNEFQSDSLEQEGAYPMRPRNQDSPHVIKS